jgi:hypothetical protein
MQLHTFAPGWRGLVRGVQNPQVIWLDPSSVAGALLVSFSITLSHDARFGIDSDTAMQAVVSLPLERAATEGRRSTDPC